MSCQKADSVEAIRTGIEETAINENGVVNHCQQTLCTLTNSRVFLHGLLTSPTETVDAPFRDRLAMLLNIRPLTFVDVQAIVLFCLDEEKTFRCFLTRESIDRHSFLDYMNNVSGMQHRVSDNVTIPGRSNVSCAFVSTGQLPDSVKYKFYGLYKMSCSTFTLMNNQMLYFWDAVKTVGEIEELTKRVLTKYNRPFSRHQQNDTDRLSVLLHKLNAMQINNLQNFDNSSEKISQFYMQDERVQQHISTYMQARSMFVECFYHDRFNNAFISAISALQS